MFEKQLNIFIASGQEADEIDSLDVRACRALFRLCDREGLTILGIDCFTADGEYLQSHIWDLFCLDYLIDLEGWHWMALRQHLLSARQSAGSTAEPNSPRFRVTVARDWLSPERAADTRREIAELRQSGTAPAKDFFRPKQIITVVLD